MSYERRPSDAAACLHIIDPLEERSPAFSVSTSMKTSEAVTNIRPSGLKSSPVTEPPCPSNLRMTSSVSGSHRTALFPLGVATKTAVEKLTNSDDRRVSLPSN